MTPAIDTGSAHDFLIESLHRRWLNSPDGDRPALVSPFSTMTFRQLALSAEWLGQRVRERAATIEDFRLAIVLDSSMESVVSVWAALVTSGPRHIALFDAGTTPQRLEQLWRLFDPDAVIGPVEVLDRLPCSCPSIPLAFPDTIEPATGSALDIPAKSAAGYQFLLGALRAPGTAIRPDYSAQRVNSRQAPYGGPTPDADAGSVDPSAWNKILVLFTSGSEGRPKGVRHSLRTLFPALHNQTAAMGICHGQTQLLTTSPAHVIGLLGLLRALLLETPLCMGGGSDLTAIVDLVRREHVDGLHTVPTWWRAFVREWGRRHGGESLPFRSVLLSGEPVHFRDHAQAARLLAPECRFVVGFGATEAPTFCFHHWMGPPLEGEATMSVGRAAAGRSIRLSGPSGETVAPGEAGTVVVSGDDLWLGYWDEPDDARPTVRAEFRMGDIGRIDADGSLHVLGRTDRLVKIAGHLVNPVDLERALASYPGIEDACCVLRRSDPSPRLVAGYTVNVDAAPDPDRLKAFLAERLESELLPEALVRLDTLPRTGSGKLDWQRVEALLLGVVEARVVRAESCSPTYLEMRSLWRKFVPGAQGLPDENFYRLGGDSLLAIQLCFAVEAAFDLALPLTLLLQYPVLHDLAEFVDGRLASRDAVSEGAAAPASSVAPDAPEHRTGLTPGQRAIWLDHQRVGGAALYHLIADYEIRGPLDASALQWALDGLVSAHEAFRRFFSVADARPFQAVAASAHLPLLRIELPTGDASPGRVRTLLEQVGRAPFDLEKPPLARAALLSITPEHHYFVLVFHHLIIDGNSFATLYRDLEQAYGAAVANDEPIPRLAVTDFSYLNHVRRAAARAGDERERALAFWREYLRDRPEDDEAASDFRGEDAWFTLPVSLLEKLDTTARALETTRFVLLLASYQVAWMRFTGQADTIVGAPYSGRIEPDLVEPISFFVNTLPIRTRLRPEMRFDVLVADLKRTTTTVFELQAYPGADLAADLGFPARPLFRRIFALQPDRRGLRLGAAVCQRFGVTTGTSKADLAFLVFPNECSLEVLCEYRPALFSPAKIASFVASWQILLERALEAPATPLGKLPLLSAETRQQVDRWSGRGRARADLPESLPDLVERWARAGPERVAARDSTGRAVTYGQVWTTSGRVAGGLQRRGVRRGSRVGYGVERSADTPALLLGILRAGAAYVPVALGESSFQQGALRTAALDLIIASQDDHELVRGVSHGAIVTPQELWQANDPLGEPAALVPDDLACVFFTSGTAGRLKGVRVPHRGIVRLVKEPEFARYDQDTVQLQLAPITFDASTIEIWGPLANGGTVVFAPERTLTVGEIGHLIQREGINTLWLTAGLFHLVADAEELWLRGLRTLMAGGDVLSPVKVKRIRERYPRLQLVNGYGPTENTTFSCCHPITSTDAERASIPVGTPIRGTEAHVLGPGGERLPPECVGEICLGGDGLFLGYLDDRDDDGCWVAHPDADGVLYRTGDYGSWNADGTLAFAGRRDRQVKIRGFRVELDAVERRLAGLAGVAELAVDIDRTDRLHPRTVAHYVAEPGCTTGKQALLNAARAALPVHEVPARFVEHATLPLTAEGKIDRRALRQRSGDATAPAAAATELSGQLEQTIAAVWHEVLNVPIHAQSDFFDLGGDSLQALRAVLELETRLHVRLPLSVLFRARTPRTLAASLARRDTLPDFHHLVPLRVGDGSADVAIFFVHGPALSLLSVVPVASMLPLHIPVYGLQGDPETLQSRDFVHIASEYASEIRRFQPQGPYFLAGYSLGGLFAHEVARQLAMAGGDVGRLFLIDAYPWNLPVLVRWAVIWSNLVLSLPKALTLTFARRVGRKVMSVVAQAAGPRRARPLDAAQELRRRHRPTPHSVCATLFLAHRTTSARRLGWHYLVRGRLEVKRVPGTHLTILRDGVASIVATLAAHYDRRSPAGSDNRVAARRAVPFETR